MTYKVTEIALLADCDRSTVLKDISKRVLSATKDKRGYLVQHKTALKYIEWRKHIQKNNPRHRKSVPEERRKYYAWNQPCWTCSRVLDKSCTWADPDKREPVEGWQAHKLPACKDCKYDTFAIKRCPKYKYWGKGPDYSARKRSKRNE